jgi:AraC family transcriptional activator of pyochelin receptor
MTNTLTIAEFQEIRAESLQIEELRHNTDGFDRIEKNRHRFSCDYYQGAELRPGLRLEIIDEKYHDALCVESSHGMPYPLVSKFYLSGSNRVLTPGIKEVKDDYVEKVNQNYLFYLPNLDEIEQTQAGEHIHLVKIETEINFLRTFSMGFESLSPNLSQLIESEGVQRFHQPLGKITPGMQLALQQILNCPYQGMTKRLYLESKTLELLAMQFAQWGEAEKQSTLASTLRADDIERVHYAREILMGRWETPPSLLELTRQVGLNDYKLKQGFRQVFGTSVFGYLQDYRLERAKQFLADEKLSIAGVAQRVGYASQSHFCYLFKRQFGITPRVYRASCR